MFRGVVVTVRAEITDALQLDARFGRKLAESGFELAVMEDMQRIRIQIRKEILLSFFQIVRIFLCEEAVVLADFRVDGVGGFNPLDGAFDLEIRTVKTAISLLLHGIRMTRSYRYSLYAEDAWSAANTIT